MASPIIYSYYNNKYKNKAHTHKISTVPRIVLSQSQQSDNKPDHQIPRSLWTDDVEFLYPWGRNSTVEYRSASRIGNFDFDVNGKRIKALRLALEKKGWASEETF